MRFFQNSLRILYTKFSFKSLELDVAKFLALRIIGAVLWLLYTIVLARSLDLEEFAIVVYSINVGMLSALVISLGNEIALLRFVARSWGFADASTFRAVLVKCRKEVSYFGFIFLLFMAIAHWAGLETPATDDLTVAILCGVIGIISAQTSLSQDFLRGAGYIWQSQIGFNIIRTVVPTVLSFAWAVFFDLTVLIALTIYAISVILSMFVQELIVFLALSRYQGSGTEDVQTPSVRFEAMKVWPGNIANAIQMRSGGLIAGLVLSPEYTALFLAAERFANVAHFPIAAVTQASAPAIARVASLRKEEAQAYLRNASRLMMIGASMGCFLALGLGWVGLFLLGSEYVQAFPILCVILAGYFSWSFFGLGQIALQNLGHFDKFSIISVVGCCLCVLASVAGAHLMGYIGLAFVYSLSWWATNAAFVFAVYHITGRSVGVSALTRQS